MIKLLKIILLSLSIFFLAGCAVSTQTSPGNLSELVAVSNVEEQNTTSISGGVSLVPAPLKIYFDKNKHEGMRNQVQHDMELGISALELGRHKCAKIVLEDAYRKIETVYADNDAAKAARSNFVPESNKDFKGEPYERAMVGYYLGLTDMMSGDLENAKVSFRWGEFQDTMSASEDYQSDLAIMNMLMGWVDQCNGDSIGAEEHYKIAIQYNDTFVIPDESHNLLLIGETGKGPVKIQSGDYKDALSYDKSPAMTAQEVVFFTNESSIKGFLTEDIYRQATTLGGRQVDKILAGKAQFKENAENISNVTSGIAEIGLDTAVVSSLLGDSDVAGVGLAFAVGGFLFSAVSDTVADATKPEADIRYWNNLPEHIYTATTKINMSGDIPKTVSTTYTYDDNTTPMTLESNIYRTGNCYLSWSRDSISEINQKWDKDNADHWVPLATAP